MTFLQSQRLYLKKLSVNEDLEHYLSMVNDATNVNMIEGLGQHPLNIDDLKKYIENYQGQLLSIFDKSDVHVGNIGLSHFNYINRSVAFGIIMAPAHRGKGYAKEASKLALAHAFDNLNLHRVYLEVVVSNQIAINLYESIGFIREGEKRQGYWSQGHYHNLYCYSLLQTEFSS